LGKTAKTSRFCLKMTSVVVVGNPGGHTYLPLHTNFRPPADLPTLMKITRRESNPDRRGGPVEGYILMETYENYIYSCSGELVESIPSKRNKKYRHRFPRGDRTHDLSLSSALVPGLQWGWVGYRFRYGPRAEIGRTENSGSFFSLFFVFFLGFGLSPKWRHIWGVPPYMGYHSVPLSVLNKIGYFGGVRSVTVGFIDQKLKFTCISIGRT